MNKPQPRKFGGSKGWGFKEFLSYDMFIIYSNFKQSKRNNENILILLYPIFSYLYVSYDKSAFLTWERGAFFNAKITVNKRTIRCNQSKTI